MIKKFIPIERGYKCRIYPNQEQKQVIKQTIGSCRWIYNHFLDKAKSNGYKTKTKYIKQLPKLKKEYNWLRKADSIALQQAVRDLDQAFQNFFDGKQNYPKFKSKKRDKLSYRTQYFKRSSGTESIEIKDNYIKLPKLGWIKFANYSEEDITGKINNVTVMQSRTGKFHIAINTKEVKVTEANYNIQNAIGIDLGIKTFAVTSNNDKIENPRHLQKYEDKLAHLQRKLAKKEEGSNNYKKLKKRIAKVHEKIKNVRHDFLHKLSTRLVQENQLICLESLNIEGMLKNLKLAKHIQNVAWGKFVKMLEYKGRWYDCIIQKVDTFFASSQICSECGRKNPKIKDLSIRQWTCQCGAEHNRDKNAANNLLAQGKKQLAS